ncbi:MAG: flagellar basal body-associated protein FliL [Centipeda sp. (in: firmicutes)]|uniref:flagellar basal body-associated FliL family protein n=1 Tax=Selenomonas sp. oral taxon 920 TaxID=1884263 RepID=UPI000840ECD7|nr:flagellar basal body-associated FliL family protein [Selenomonas sp. oral taxon 920]AOH48502.1 flagellar basal body protein FliL [Selenomonas sp. oral taxon 920]
MAEEKEEQAVEQPKQKSPMLMMIVVVIVAVLVAVAAAGGISYYIFSQAESTSHSDDGGGSKSNHDPGVFYKLGDPKEGILVNVGGGRSGKFLKAGIVLELNPGKSDNVVDGKVGSVAETKILDTTMQFLRAAPLEEFDASKQDALKKQLKDALNERLGQGSVYDVYITSFLLQ